MSGKEKVEISQEAIDEFNQIKSKCEKKADSEHVFTTYVNELESSLLDQIQLKINWNKAAQRQK